MNDVLKKILCIPAPLKDSNLCCCKHSPVTSRQSPSSFHSCYLIFIVLAHRKAKEGEGQSSGSRKHPALCDHLPNTSLTSWRGAMLAGCTGSIHIANCVMSSRTTTRFFLHLMMFDWGGEGERKGRSGQCAWKGRAHAIVRTLKTNCPCAKDFSVYDRRVLSGPQEFSRGQKAPWVGKLWLCPVFPL